MEDFIVRALDSIPRRDDIEIIIVDDASTDRTVELIENYEGLDVRLVRHETNMGVSAAMNDGMDLAEGEYLYELDSDDYLYTEEFEKAVDLLNGEDMVFVKARINDGRILHQGPDNMNCAMWFKFVRRDFVGDCRRENNFYGGDREMNDHLMSMPHTEKHTDLVAYHYNFPREGSICWKMVH